MGAHRFIGTWRSIIFVALAGSLLSACAGEPWDEQAEEDLASTQQELSLGTFSVTVSAGMTSLERCRIPSAYFDPTHSMYHPDMNPFDDYDPTTVFRRGEQVMIKRGTTLRGLCTVDSVASSSSSIEVSQTLFNNRVKIGQETTTATGVTLTNQHGGQSTAPEIAEPASSLADARTNSADKVKEFMARGADTRVIFTAPHPFEDFTFSQVEDIHNHNPTRNGVWAVGIHNNDTTADAKYHITSTELSWRSFPALYTIVRDNPWGRPPDYAVSFHRQTSCAGVDIQVGGGTFPELRQGVAEILAEYLAGEGLSVHWDDTGGCALSGADPFNYINWLGWYGGVQLEQSPAVLDNAPRRQKVNDAIRSVFDCLHDGADTEGETGTSGTLISTSTTTYATSGECPRWIAEIDETATWFSGAPQRTLDAGVSACVPGDSAHVDFYSGSPVDTYWYRIGGGTIHYVSGPDGTCQAVKVTTGSTPWLDLHEYAAGVGSGQRYRAVVRATGANGQPKGAYFSVE